MHAIVVDGSGGPEVLRWTSVDDPTCGPDQVVVDVVAAGVNRADVLQRQGRYPPPRGASPLLGLEVAGTVADVGAHVRRWRRGDEVTALLAGGGYAERVCVDDRHVLPVPHGVSLLDAAALPEAAATVWSNLVDVARMERGDWLLVHGGASGIGTFATQFAAALGVHTITTVGDPGKAASVSQLGAEHVVLYRDQDFVQRVHDITAGRGADVVLDLVGAAYLDRNLRALAADGRLVVIGLQEGRRAELDLGRLLAKRASVHGTTLRARSDDAKATIVRGVERDVWPQIEAGLIRAVVHERFAMPDAAQAHRVLEAGTHVGKLVLVR